MKRLRTRQFHILIISIFSILSLSALIHAQRPKPEPTSPASPQINEAKERERKNEVNKAFINRKMEDVFTKFPSSNKELPNKTVLYLIVGSDQTPGLYEFTDFNWDPWGDQATSEGFEKLNGTDWEWKGGAVATAYAYRYWDEKLANRVPIAVINLTINHLAMSDFLSKKIRNGK